MKIKQLSMLIIAGCVMVGCSDDDSFTPENVECEIIEDVGIKELLSILESTPDIYVTENTLTYEDAHATNDVHNVHYFGSGTNEVIDKNLYKAAYENGHYFFVSERNVNELREILGEEFSVDITIDPKVNEADFYGLHVESTPLNFPESPYDATDEEWDGIMFEHDSTFVDIDVVEEIPESDHYMLFNKNMEMFVAVPIYNHIPHLTVEAMVDAIYKYQDDTPKSRAGTVPASEPVLFTWTGNYNYVMGGKTIHTNSQTITAAYTMSGCYSYSTNRDYYMLQQEVTTYNAQLNTFRGKVKHFYKGDDYYVYAGYASSIEMIAALGDVHWALKNPNNNKYHLIQSSPQTTIGSASVTTGVSYNIGGNVGLTTSGPEAGLSAGATFSDSRTMNIPDVAVSNYCFSGSDGKKDDARYTHWRFDIADPYGHSDYMNTGHLRWQIEDVVKIGSTTATYCASHIWAVDDPKNNFTPRFAVCVKAYCGMTAGRQNWLGYQRWFDNIEFMGDNVIRAYYIGLDTPKRD